ncbi:Uma2 family endonuclease [Nocardia farcinica]|uniref:Uma2 family endonuclease n=1 Tax=Nocardia farcinica TaxID=37329 RepID=UPI001F07D3C7|nr:Uma2 family endonuclease [Nocardia farcinica]
MVSARASAERIPGSHPAPEPPVCPTGTRAGTRRTGTARGPFPFPTRSAPRALRWGNDRRAATRLGDPSCGRLHRRRVPEAAWSSETHRTDRRGSGLRDLVLAVEAVSPDSEERDRETKPLKYANAGIPHFWRVERGSDDRVVVYAYELDRVSARYVPIGIFHDRLKLPVPFPVDIDLEALGRRG